MAIRSRREAQRLGRLGGKESARLGGRFGNIEWGRRMRRLKGARHQRLGYPTLRLLWLENARRTKAGLPLLAVPLADTPAALASREARQLRRWQESLRPGPRPRNIASSS